MTQRWCLYFLGLHVNYYSLMNQTIFKRWFVNTNIHSPKFIYPPNSYTHSTPNMNIILLKMRYMSAKPPLHRSQALQELLSPSSVCPSSPELFSPSQIWAGKDVSPYLRDGETWASHIYPTNTIYEDSLSSTVPVFTLPEVVTAQLSLQLRISTQIVQEWQFLGTCLSSLPLELNLFYT